MYALFVPFVAAQMAVGMTPNPQPISVSSKIDQVTVFLSGAQVHREGWFTAQTGVSEIVLSGVSPYVDANSLQARGVGEFTIMDVKFETHYPQPDPIENDPNKIPADVLRKMKVLRDSLSIVQYKLDEVRSKKEVRNLERQMLLNNGTVKGVGKVNDSIQLLQAAMAYFHLKMTEINMDLLALNRTETEWVQKQSGLNSRYADLQNWSSRNNLNPNPVKGPDYRIVVTVNTDKPIKGKIEVGYLVTEAGWVPSYDIRAKDANSPVDLQYKANVHQNSGEEWENVALTLSSSNPYISQSKPEMSPWYIDYYAYNEHYYKDKSAGYSQSRAKEMEEDAKSTSPGSLGEYQENLNLSANGPKDYLEVAETMVSAEFRIKLPYTIKSDNKEHLVSVTSEALKAKYMLALVPKLDRNAFLVGYVSDWEDLNLLPARANIYYDGTYVGQSYIDPTAMEDTLKLALGRDVNVSATRKKLKDKTKEKILGENRVKEVGYEIVVKNTHGYTINLIVEDQVPVSRNNEIKVELTDIGKAEHTEYNGFLKWTMNVKAGATEKIKFGYAVKWDKNKNLSLNL
ncbi:MAG: DUF4139 domain-containing protein [Flavobacteriales bacterium]